MKHKILVTQLDTNNERIKAVAQEKPSYYLLKPDHALLDLILKIKELLSDANHA